MNKRIAIAAGHGAGDNGATGQGSCEAVECIQIVARLDRILREDGRFEVVHVPDELGLAGEINWLNARYKGLEDGLALEIHKNSGGGHGIEAYHYAGDKHSIDMATALSAATAAATGLPNRGAKPDNSDTIISRLGGPLGWTRNVTMWSILIEAGFQGTDPIDDAADEKFAQGIYDGILQVYGLQRPAPAPAPAPVPEPGRGGGSALPAGVIPLDMPVEVTATVLRVRDDANTSSKSGVGENTGRADGNLEAGQVITIKGYKRSELVDLTAKGGLRTDIWLLTLNFNWISATGTDFFTRMPDVPMVAPAPAPEPAKPAPTPAEMFAAKYNVTKLPGGDTQMYAAGTILLHNLDDPSKTAGDSHPLGDPITVRYAASVNGEIYYLTAYSFDRQIPNGFKANELVSQLPQPPAPEPTPAPAPAPAQTGSVDGIKPPQPAGATEAAQAANPTLSLRDRLVILLAGILAIFDHK